MPSVVEGDFVAHLMDVDSMGWLCSNGFDPVIVPTPEIVQAWTYAQRYFLDSALTEAPSRLAFETFEVSAGRSLANALVDLGLDLDASPQLSVSDVVDKLTSQYALASGQRFVMGFATELTEVDGDDRLRVVSEGVRSLVRLQLDLTPRHYRQTLAEGAVQTVDAYSSNTGATGVLGVGIPEVDAHLGGVAPGELLVLGAAPKRGKSLLSVRSLLSQWEQGRRTVLFTLENSITLTFQRLVCAAVGIDSLNWQRRTCDPSELKRAEEFAERVRDSDGFIVVEPPSDQRDPASLLAMARSLEVDSVIIDQLSHVHHPNPRNKPRWEQVRDIMQMIREDANNAPRLAVMLMVQISREGTEKAAKRAYHQPEDFAESAEVERTPDFALTLFQSEDMKMANMAVMQVVAARRVPVKGWNLDWFPALALARVRSDFRYAQ